LAAANLIAATLQFPAAVSHAANHIGRRVRRDRDVCPARAGGGRRQALRECCLAEGVALREESWRMKSR